MRLFPLPLLPDEPADDCERGKHETGNYPGDHPECAPHRLLHFSSVLPPQLLCDLQRHAELLLRLAFRTQSKPTHRAVRMDASP